MSFEIKRARSKTAVFSGTRHHSTVVPRLEDLCIQKLLDNANKIECVGDVPYYILEPLLNRVTLAQLRQIESYNPQLVEDADSDKPWEQHCRRHFEGRKPRAGETWRDLFMRCERERDHKIEKIAKRIRKHEEKATPARQTRVVDNQLASGRSRAISATTVIKKTIKNHIPIKGEPSSSSTSSSVRPTTTTIVVRRDAHNGSTSKTKTAPLMQKSMQLFKSRFRR
jgi:hypothetical protein